MSRLRVRSSAVTWIVFGLAVAVFGLATDPTIVHVGSLIMVWGIWSSSFNLIWGYAGQFSLAQVGFGAVAAYTVAVLTVEYEWSFWPAVPVGIFLAVVLSLIVGATSSRLSGFNFAIMTLAFALLVLRVIQGSEITGRTIGIRSNWDIGTIDMGPVTWEISPGEGGFVFFVALILAVVLVFLGRLPGTRTGGALTAIREDEVLAQAVGVDPFRYRLVAFSTSAVIAAIGGITYAAYVRYLSPTFFAMTAVITMIVQVVVGGRGAQFGAVAGAAVYIGLSEWLHVGGDWSEGFFGLVLIALVLFAPEGLLGLSRRSRLARLVDRLRRTERSPSSPDGAVPQAVDAR